MAWSSYRPSMSHLTFNFVKQVYIAGPGIARTPSSCKAFTQLPACFIYSVFVLVTQYYLYPWYSSHADFKEQKEKREFRTRVAFLQKAEGTRPAPVAPPPSRGRLPSASSCHGSKVKGLRGRYFCCRAIIKIRAFNIRKCPRTDTCHCKE